MTYMNNTLSPRTIREWLELIPFDRARKEAIYNSENHGHYASNRIARNLSEALFGAFVFSKTKQGHIYWRSIYTAIDRMEKSVKLKNNE